MTRALAFGGWRRQLVAMEPGTRPAFSLPSDNQIRLILVTLVGLGFAIYLGMRVGEGDTKFVAGLAVLAAAVAVMAALGERAWLLLPFMMGLDVPVPISFGRDFSCGELSSMALIVYTVIRVALRRQKIVVFRRDHLWPLLYTGWALMVFALNPIGLRSFGAENVGARFYFQIALGLCTFIICTNVRVGEEEGRWVLQAILLARLMTMGYGIWMYKIGAPPPSSMNLFIADESYYTWHNLLTSPCLVLITMAFSKYSLDKMLRLQNLWLWVMMGLIFSVLIFSGKRAAVGSVILLPLFAAVLQRRYGAGVLIALCVVGILGFLALAHGRWMNLPLNVQRALSWVPGNWDMRLSEMGANDEFRKRMREVAYEEIEKHPWIGPGFVINVRDFTTDRSMFGNRITEATSGHSWHSLWLAIAADFGIPAAGIYVLLMFKFTRLSFRMARGLKEEGWRMTLAAFIFLTLCGSLAGSWTYGHAALDMFVGWWLYALLVPLSREAAAMAAHGKLNPQPASTG